MHHRSHPSEAPTSLARAGHEGDLRTLRFVESRRQGTDADSPDDSSALPTPPATMGCLLPVPIRFPRVIQPVVLLLAVVALARGQVDLAAALQTRLRCSDLPADPPACPQFVGGCSDNYVIQVLCPVACGGCEIAENTAEPPTESRWLLV